MTKPVFITRDIGLAIRDHLEQKCVTHFDEHDHELTEAGQDEVVAIDVSDPDNIIICLDNGQTFTARIFAGDPPSSFQYSLTLAAHIGAWMPKRIMDLAKRYETREEAEAAAKKAKLHPAVDTFEIEQVS